MTDIATTMNSLGIAARAAARELAQTSAEVKANALHAAATSIRAHANDILAANQKDLAAATNLTEAMRERLTLTPERIEAMAKGVDTVASLAEWDTPENGLHFQKVAVPLGVIGIIYESRPNVTADAAALAIKSGNAVILRGGSESFHSSRAILDALHEGLAGHHIPVEVAQLVPTTDREAVSHMLTMSEHIDVIIPRGGKSLNARVKNEARVPTLLHLDGNCHLYIDSAADAQMAQRITLNAKLRRTGICGALETLLFHTDTVATIAPTILAELLEKGCEVRGDAAIQKLDARIKPATEEDWSTEFLGPILAVKVVDDIHDAIAHINRYGSHHTDAIVTADTKAAEFFLSRVDSAIVLVNASTQFADGGEFGFGAEIGIATGRLHARGPVAAAELTTYKYKVTTPTPAGAIRKG